MEVLLILLALWLGPPILGAIWAALTGRAPGHDPRLSVRVERVHDADAEGYQLHRVQTMATGTVDMGLHTQGRMVTSILDVTDGVERPVYSFVEDLQERTTPAYQAVGPVTPFPNQFTMNGYVDVGAFAPEILAFPETGMRIVRVTVRLLGGMVPQLNIVGGVDRGTLARPSSVIASGDTTLSLEETGPGYLASIRRDQESLEVAVWLAIGVAQADGHMDEEELGIIREWLEGQVSRQSPSDQEAVKEACNAAMRTAYAAARSNTISLSEVAQRVRSLDDDRLQARVFELGYKVLSADGEASPSELALLDRVAQDSGVDPAIVTRLRDVELLQVARVDGDVDDDLPGLLGFDASRPREEIRAHLRKLHRTWNARSANAETDEDRGRVQFMLDSIAKAMTKYAS